MTGTCSEVKHAYLVSGKLGFSVRLVFIVSGIERSKCRFVGLTDLLELLHVIACRSKVNLSNLESCTKTKIQISTCQWIYRHETHRRSATSCSSCCSRGRSGSSAGVAALAPVVLLS